MVIIQYFLLGKQGDYLGGIFGVQQGCNAYLNIFQVIIVTKCILYCLNKRERFHSCAFKCAMALVIAAFAELKFFFFEFVLIVMIAILITNFSWRKLLIILGSIVAVYGAGIVLVRLFPNFADSMSIHGLLKIATSDKGYTSVGDMNRLTVIPMSNRLFLKNDIQRLFGFGLGNCDYATGYSFLTTPFYRRNSWTHYMWLSTASIYLEMGIVGLFFFFGFFVMVFFKVHKNQKKAQTDIVYYQMTKIMAIMGGVIAIYNSSMKTEAAYMLYFMLTLPFLKSKSV